MTLKKERGILLDVNKHQEALRRSEERYRALVDAMSQVVWSWTMDGSGNDFEQSMSWWQEITGQTIEEQKSGSQAWLQVVHPSDRIAAANSWSEALQSNSKYDSIFRIQDRLGGWRDVRVRGVPIRDSCGTVREWIGTLEDVTSQRHAAAERERLLAIAEAERKRLEDVFLHAPSFMAVLRGSDHVFERVNEQYNRIVGGRPLEGRTVRDAFPELRGQGCFELLDEVYRSGKPHTSLNSRLTLHHETQTTELEVQFVYQPMFDPAGAVSGVIVQGIDLTGQRLAEAGLAELTAEAELQRRMYEIVLSNTVDFVYLFDLDGRFTYANKSLLELWGKTLPEAVGCNFHDLDYPADVAARLQTQISTVIETGTPLRDETIYTSPAGISAYYEYIFVPVMGEKGTIEAVAGSTRDISDRKQTEESLRASEQSYRALVTATSDVVYSMSANWSEQQPLDGRGFLVSTDKPNTKWLLQNVPEFEQERLWTTIQQAILTRQTFELEHQVIRADGTLGWAFSRAVPILDVGGTIVEWFGTASDITRRKQVEFELRDIRSRMEAALSAGAIGTWKMLTGKRMTFSRCWHTN